MKAYYDARAQEYDDWYLGIGLYSDRERPGWDDELAGLVGADPGTPACAYARRRLRHRLSHAAHSRAIVGIDASERMLVIAQERVPEGEFLVADALELPFEDGSFDRLFTGHFYGHLEEEARVRFLGEARRVARELVIVDSSVGALAGR